VIDDTTDSGPIGSSRSTLRPGSAAVLDEVACRRVQEQQFLVRAQLERRLAAAVAAHQQRLQHVDRAARRRPGGLQPRDDRGVLGQALGGLRVGVPFGAVALKRRLKRSRMRAYGSLSLRRR
jgi:hypothetical protein